MPAATPVWLGRRTFTESSIEASLFSRFGGAYGAWSYYVIVLKSFVIFLFVSRNVGIALCITFNSNRVYPE